MAEFAYKIIKNRNISYINFELKYGYHFQVLFKKNINSCFQSKTAKNLASKLKDLIKICRKNLPYAQKL